MGLVTESLQKCVCGGMRVQSFVFGRQYIVIEFMVLLEKKRREEKRREEKRREEKRRQEKRIRRACMDYNQWRQ